MLNIIKFIAILTLASICFIILAKLTLGDYKVCPHKTTETTVEIELITGTKKIETYSLKTCAELEIKTRKGSYEICKKNCIDRFSKSITAGVISFEILSE